MTWQSLVFENRYEDSVRLLGLARALRVHVRAAEVVVGSEGNLRVLAERHDLVVDAGPSDVVVAVDAEDEAAADAALGVARAHFEQAQDGASAQIGELRPARSLLSAWKEIEANVALVSVPGEYAALEAAKALEAGLHVLLFSDHVALEDEVALKRLASSKGLLLMGPGCGTAMFAGVGLGFANAVRPGPVGIVAAAGTGAQEAACLLDASEVGVSHIVGVGGRDLSLEVGGVMMLAGAELLAQDASTEVILLISKPPAGEVVARLVPRLPRAKPVVACFVGYEGREAPLAIAATLEEAARLAAKAAGGKELAVDESLLLAAGRAARGRLARGQRALRGLFSGGTLCFEALVVLRAMIGPVASNLGGDRDGPHLVLDLGEEEFTAGRPHPMVDQSLRIERLLAEADDPAVACVLLDVVLGYGAHPDPASELAPAIVEARRRAQSHGRELVVIAHVCGTDRDPQSASRQELALADAGAMLAPANALAARLAATVIAEAA